MEKKKFGLGILALALVVGIAVVGCDNGNTPDTTNGGETNTWLDVTSFSQVNGAWEAPSSTSGTIQGINYTVNRNKYILTFYATTKTMSASGSVTETFSGGNINTYWPTLKTNLEYLNQMDGITVTVNDANHSTTTTYNNYSQVLTDSELKQLGFQINNDGTKLKVMTSGIEVIYTKTTNPSIKPAAPSGLAAGTITSNSIAITWNRVSGATGYTVYAGTSS
jgi:hypothetical protein